MDLQTEEEADFRPGKSTIDHLYALTQVIGKKGAIGQAVSLLLAGLKKAYNSVPVKKIKGK